MAEDGRTKEQRNASSDTHYEPSPVGIDTEIISIFYYSPLQSQTPSNSRPDELMV